MSSDAQTEQAQGTEQTRERGYVKWFNNRAGYGFITASEGARKDDDVFVHHSALRTNDEQYKYLVQGEYVEFEWIETDGGSEHQWQAGNVKGVDGGCLMCETRNNTRQQHATEANGDTRSRPRSNKNRYRGGGPRSGSRTFRDEEGVEWMLVRRKTE